MSQVSESEWLTTEEAAAYLNVAPRWLKRAIAERRITRYKLGRHNRFKRSDLDAYVENRCVPANEKPVG